MIIRSRTPVEICEFTEGWEQGMLMGSHEIDFVVAKDDAIP